MKKLAKEWLRLYWGKVIIFGTSFLYMFFGYGLMDNPCEWWHYWLSIIMFGGGFVMFLSVSIRAMHWLIKDILTDFVEHIIDQKLENKENNHEMSKMPVKRKKIPMLEKKHEFVCPECGNAIIR